MYRDKTKPATSPPKLLPHLAGWMDGKAAPKKWRELQSRERLIESLPIRVYSVLLCECAASVLPLWVAVYPHDKKPHKSIVARLRYCLLPTKARAARAAGAAGVAGVAWAAGAAGAAWAAGAARATGMAGATGMAWVAWAAWAAGAAGAAWAAGAARAAGMAGAAQWRWMYAAYRNCVSPEWSASWNTTTVKSLARLIWRRREWSAMPILADALEDAGCDNAELLKRLRDPETLFTRADCALWQPMGLGESP